jgi:TP901-1 family phage major tail protein
MAAQKGREFLLKAGTAAAGVALAGLRDTSFRVNNSPVDVSTKDSAGWQELMADAELSSLEIQASGLFDDDAALETVRGYAFARTINAFGLIFDNGDTLDADFMVTSFERSGSYNGAEQYSVTLVSSGAPTFTAA